MALLAALAALAAPAFSMPPARQDSDKLTLDEARQYMVELINRDRAAKRLLPVKLDPVATAAGQRHAEEMAAQRYLAHWNLLGKLPDQRYTEAGGVDHDRENVYLLQRKVGDGGADEEPLPLIQNPTFTRHEIEEIEASYFNETPPNDGHRRNILAPEHTHLGVALARAGTGAQRTLANTQEFVDRYVEVDPIPQVAAPADRITVSGRCSRDHWIRAVTVARIPLPTPLSREALGQTRQYAVPVASVSYMEDSNPLHPLHVDPDGRFHVRFPVADRGRAGVYYVQVWVDDGGRDLIASQRTVVVR